mmetsp:Transcript_12231/g.28021  ORF Transcript_12231/g.28021 Transcript_12231/m.28021 type:complete len:499 (-) Transcript_12231:88-1584(-)
MRVTLSLLPAASAGFCAQQCVVDSDCEGCGAAGTGRCSQAAISTAYPAIGASCVSIPTDPPSEPAASVSDSAWPLQWSADVEAVVYGDFTDKVKNGKGKIYYDGTNGFEKEVWTPYTSGKDTTQTWIKGNASAESRYYVESTLFKFLWWKIPLCIYFPITDPGVGSTVNVERADWMQNCDSMGYAKYLAREVVAGEWTDHYACVLDYDEGPKGKVNQTIVFQNWHSLGLGSTPKGLPVRVTGGNSAPNPTQGSPRLSTVFYTGFQVGPEAVAGQFVEPKEKCLKVGKKEVEQFLGVGEVTREAMRDPDMRRRVGFLPHAEPATEDLVRARTKRPRSGRTGEDLPRAMKTLNQWLLAEEDLATRDCAQFNLTQLHQLQEELYLGRSPALQEIYHGDNRQLDYQTLAALRAAHHQQRLHAAQAHLEEMVRDGLCHEVVMMFVHHLSASAREVIKATQQLPLLPEHAGHARPAEGAEAFDRYSAQVSCAVCHIQPQESVVV